MPVDFFEAPDTPGLAGLVTADDPTGGGQDCAEQQARNRHGDIVPGAVRWIRTPGGKLKLHIGNSNAPADPADDPWERDANGRVKVLYP